MRQKISPIIFILAAGLLAAPVSAQSFSASKRQAVKALKKAARQVKSKTTCNANQGDNIREALSKAKRMTPQTRVGAPEDLNLFLAGLSLGAAFSGCPSELYDHITVAQGALSNMNAALLSASDPGGYDDDDDDDDDDFDDEVEPGIEAELHIDPHATGKRREPALLVEAEDVVAHGLRGAKVSWMVKIKRAKKRGWKRAKTFKIGKTRIKRDHQKLGDVSLTLRYSTMARKGLRPGKHEGVLIAKVGRSEVFSEGFRFRIEDEDDFDDNELDDEPIRVSRREPVGPLPMTPRAFNGFASSLRSTSSDLSKLDMIRSVARKNHFTSDQLGTLLGQTNSDLTRMDIAKAVVPKVVDRENAYGHASKFRSSLSREDYTELLAGG